MHLSMSNHIKKIFSVVLCSVVAAVFITVMFFCVPVIKETPECSSGVVVVYDRIDNETVKKEYEIGKDFAALRISDIGKLGKITKVNYVADDFVYPDHMPDNIEIVDLTKPFDFAEKGTLIFIILNLDPESETFIEQTEKLAEYKIGDFWNFHFSLPPVFGASNIYLKSKLLARHGEISDYDFIEFNTTYDKKTETFSTESQRTDIPLSFYTRRHTMSDAFASAQTITVHYQSAGSVYSGIKQLPLIGEESAVKNVHTHSQNILIAVAILSAVVFAVLVTLTIIERSVQFVSQVVWMFGIAVMLLSRFLAADITSVPLFWTAASMSAPFIILGGALLYMCKNIGKAPTKIIFPSLAAVGGVIAFVYPFVPFGAANAVRITSVVIRAVCAAALAFFTVLALISKTDKHEILQTSCTAVIGVTIIASLFLPQISPTYINPIFYLCIGMTVATFVIVFIQFYNMRKSNSYLTSNLHKEVERQVSDMKAIISERDKLLQFVSHDMKKPLLSSVTLLNSTIEREKDGEQIKALQIIKQNDERVVNNLSQVGGYAKFNYLAEPSKVVDLREFCTEICRFHKFDCNANGIVLKNLVVGRVKAFVKKQGLENTVSNIIMNAVEHADCSEITLSVKADKKQVSLLIADNGKGVSDEIDVFKPYVSENNSETGGIGLYICKNIIESMNGTLTYTSNTGHTVFCIALLKA